MFDIISHLVLMKFFNLSPSLLDPLLDFLFLQVCELRQDNQYHHNFNSEIIAFYLHRFH